MAHQILTPVTAAGSTAERYLHDRFADCINVKDYGAAGDGATDDTAAFDAAVSVSAGRGVFVPDGSYVLTKDYNGKRLYCVSDGVSFSRLGVDCENIALRRDWEALKHRRRLVARLDTSPLFTSGFTSYTWQSFEVTPSYYFIGMTAVKTSDSLSYGYVAMYDRACQHVTTFCTGVLSSTTPYNQMLSVFEGDSTITLYTVTADSATDTSNYPAKYVLTKALLPASGNDVTPAATYKNITLRYNGFVLDGDMIVVCNHDTPFSTITDYTYFKKYDFEQNLLGYFKIFSDNSGSSVETVTPKMQSITSAGGVIACGCGGYYSDSSDPVTMQMNYGLKIFNSNGDKIFSSICKPAGLAAALRSKLSDENITVIENEGVSILAGRIYTLSRLTPTSVATGSIGIFEELSASPEAIDCSSFAAQDFYPSPSLINRHAVPFIEGARVNPYTGETLAGAGNVLDMMVNYDMPEVIVYTGITPFKRIDNTTNFPNYTLIHFKKGNNNTIFSEMSGAYIADAGLCSKLYYNGGAGSWVENIAPVNVQNVYLGDNAAANAYGRVYGFKHTDSSAVQILRWFDDGSVSRVQVGGESDVANVDLLAGARITATASAFYGASGQTLGTQSAPWGLVYSETGGSSSSDARLKTDVEDIPESLFRAWGRVRFCLYKFIRAIEKKGEAARIHIGAIAQEVQDAFAAEGLDASRYGLFCHDSWSATPEVVDENGAVVVEAQAAGDRYSLRYSEVLALECAYQRWRLAQIESRINAREDA